MRPATASNVERHLFEAGGWLSSPFLMAHWDLSERGLRRMLAGVAVAGEKGYIHVFHASKDELEAYCKPKQAHAVGELKNLKRLRLNHWKRHCPDETVAPVLAASIQPELLP